MEIQQDTSKLEVKQLKTQLRSLCENQALTDVFTTFEDNVARLLRENELLRHQNLQLEVKELEFLHQQQQQLHRLDNSGNSNNSNQLHQKKPSNNVAIEKSINKQFSCDHHANEKHNNNNNNSSFVGGGDEDSLNDINIATTSTESIVDVVTVPTSSYAYREESFQLQAIKKENLRLLSRLKKSGQEREQLKVEYEKLKGQERQFLMSSKIAHDSSRRLRVTYQELIKVRKELEIEKAAHNAVERDLLLIKEDCVPVRQSEAALKEERCRLLAELATLRLRVREVDEERQRMFQLNRFITKHVPETAVTAAPRSNTTTIANKSSSNADSSSSNNADSSSSNYKVGSNQNCHKSCSIISERYEAASKINNYNNNNNTCPTVAAVKNDSGRNSKQRQQQQSSFVSNPRNTTTGAAGAAVYPFLDPFRSHVAAVLNNSRATHHKTTSRDAVTVTTLNINNNSNVNHNSSVKDKYHDATLHLSNIDDINMNNNNNSSNDIDALAVAGLSNAQYVRIEESNGISPALEVTLTAMHEAILEVVPTLLPLFRKLSTEIHNERTHALQQRAKLLAVVYPLRSTTNAATNNTDIGNRSYAGHNINKAYNRLINDYTNRNADSSSTATTNISYSRDVNGDVGGGSYERLVKAYNNPNKVIYNRSNSYDEFNMGNSNSSISYADHYNNQNRANHSNTEGRSSEQNKKASKTVRF